MTGDGEELLDLIGGDALAAHARAEGGVVELAASHVADATEHAFLRVGHMFLEPGGEDVLHAMRQAQHGVAGADGISLARGVEDGGDLSGRSGRVHRCDQYTDRNPRRGKLTDRVETMGG